MTNACPLIDMKKSPKSIKPSDGKILNPISGRYVNEDGQIGELLKKLEVLDKLPSPVKVQSPVKTKIPIKKTVPVPASIKKDIYSLINETGNVIKGQISNYDKLKLNMVGLKNITFTDEKYVPFLTKLNEPTSYGQISMKDDEFIHGHYKKKIHFVIQQHKTSYDLIIQEGDVHLLIKDAKKALKSNDYPCDIFHPRGKSDLKVNVIESTKEFLLYVFGVAPELSASTYEFVYPAKYEEDKTQKTYNISKPPPSVAIINSEDGQYDPCFVSKINDEVVYVFHVHKPEYPTMKGYIPLGVTIVLRELKKVNYRYTNIIRLSYPSWGVYFSDNVDDLSLYMRELKNIINSIGFLAKFKGFSPYPRILTGCKVSPRRNQLRTCEK